MKSYWFFRGKELPESILILTRLWENIYVITLVRLIKYRILSYFLDSFLSTFYIVSAVIYIFLFWAMICVVIANNSNYKK